MVKSITRKPILSLQTRSSRQVCSRIGFSHLEPCELSALDGTVDPLYSVPSPALQKCLRENFAGTRDNSVGLANTFIANRIGIGTDDRDEICRHAAQGGNPRQSERGADLPEVVAREKGVPAGGSGCARHRRHIPAGREPAQRPRRNAGAIGDRDHPPLHAPLHLELCDRPRHVSAGLLHDEVQPARERGGRGTRWHRQRASLSAGVARRRVASEL